MSSISIIISCYNQNKSVTKIIDLLEAGSHTIQEVIVADDGSSPPLQETLGNLSKKHIQKYIFLTHADKGFRKCKILNEAIRRSSSEYILFLDGDCLPHKHFVKDHIGMAEKGYFVQGRRCFVNEKSVTPLLESKTSLSKLIFSGKVSGLLKSTRLPFPFIKRNTSMYGILGCNLGVWHDDLLAVNGFDEDFEGWGREDSDLGARLYNLGLRRKIVYGRAQVYHLNHPINKKDQLAENDRKLEATISEGKVRCVNGLAKE